MKLILITHAEGENTKKELFSGITPAGRKKVEEAALELQKRKYISERLEISKVVTSPHTRCVDTTFSFIRYLSGFKPGTPNAYPKLPSYIFTDESLMEDNSKWSSVLKLALSEGQTAIILGVHNNLIVELPDNIKAHTKSWSDGEFFSPRPVLIVAELNETECRLIFAAAPVATGWQTVPS